MGGDTQAGAIMQGHDAEVMTRGLRRGDNGAEVPLAFTLAGGGVNVCSERAVADDDAQERSLLADGVELQLYDEACTGRTLLRAIAVDTEHLARRRDKWPGLHGCGVGRG